MGPGLRSCWGTLPPGTGPWPAPLSGTLLAGSRLDLPTRAAWALVQGHGCAREHVGSVPSGLLPSCPLCLSTQRSTGSPPSGLPGSRLQALGCEGADSAPDPCLGEASAGLPCRAAGHPRGPSSQAVSAGPFTRRRFLGTAVGLQCRFPPETSQNILTETYFVNSCRGSLGSGSVTWAGVGSGSGSGLGLRDSGGLGQPELLLQKGCRNSPGQAASSWGFVLSEAGLRKRLPCGGFGSSQTPD